MKIAKVIFQLLKFVIIAGPTLLFIINPVLCLAIIIPFFGIFLLAGASEKQ